jgi:hypothetical protein
MECTIWPLRFFIGLFNSKRSDVKRTIILLWFYKFRSLRLLFGQRIERCLVDALSCVDAQVALSGLLGLLVTSNNAAVSRFVLTVMISFPDELLEQHCSLRKHFYSGRVAPSSVRDALLASRDVIDLCFIAY